MNTKFNPFATGGEIAHWMRKKTSEMGVYTPRAGYYKIVEIPPSPIVANSGKLIDSDNYTASANKVKTMNGDDRTISLPIYANYDSDSYNNFNNEVVLIEGKPLFNGVSNGPFNANFKVGDIIHVKDSILSNNRYVIDWELL